MIIKTLSISWWSHLPLLGLSVTMALTGCSTIAEVPAPDTTPIHTPVTGNPVSNDKTFIQCPPFNPERTMCTMQYDPVCAKIKTGSVINYRTAGNACSACTTPEAIGYAKGECLP